MFLIFFSPREATRGEGTISKISNLLLSFRRSIERMFRPKIEILRKQRYRWRHRIKKVRKLKFGIPYPLLPRFLPQRRIYVLEGEGLLSLGHPFRLECHTAEGGGRRFRDRALWIPLPLPTSFIISTRWKFRGGEKPDHRPAGIISSRCRLSPFRPSRAVTQSRLGFQGRN